MEKITFDYYRYQLVPSKSINFDLFDPEVNNVEQLKIKKNFYFATVLNEVKFKSQKSGLLPYKQVLSRSEIFFILLSNKVEKEIIKDFSIQKIITEPYVKIIIDNNPNNQIIAISRNFDAFYDTKAVVNIIQQSLGYLLSKYNLTLHIQPIFKKEEFWSLVSEKKVDYITFEIIKPNITDIAGSFRDDLRTLIDSSNSHTTTLRLKAPEKGNLENVNPNNELIDSLVEYSAAGGGNIKVKLKYKKEVYQTSQSIMKEIVNFDIDLESSSPDAIYNALKLVLSSCHEADR